LEWQANGFAAALLMPARAVVTAMCMTYGNQTYYN